MPISTVAGVMNPVRISRTIAYGVDETNMVPRVATSASSPERSVANHAIGSSTSRSPRRSSSDCSTTVLAFMPIWLANQNAIA